MDRAGLAGKNGMEWIGMDTRALRGEYLYYSSDIVVVVVEVGVGVGVVVWLG